MISDGDAGVGDQRPLRPGHADHQDLDARRTSARSSRSRRRRHRRPSPTPSPPSTQPARASPPRPSSTTSGSGCRSPRRRPATPARSTRLASARTGAFGAAHPGRRRPDHASAPALRNAYRSRRPPTRSATCCPASRFTVSEAAPTGAGDDRQRRQRPRRRRRKVQAFVDAANAVLGQDQDTTPTAARAAPRRAQGRLLARPDWRGQVLDAVSSAIGASDATAGLTSSPVERAAADQGRHAHLRRRRRSRPRWRPTPPWCRPCSAARTRRGADDVPNTPDDSVGVDGIAARLAVLGHAASDAATGTLTSAWPTVRTPEPRTSRTRSTTGTLRLASCASRPSPRSSPPWRRR